MLTITQDDQNVTVRQGDRVLLNYRYSDETVGPHISSLGANDVSAPVSVSFNWRVDGVDFRGPGEESGRQTHEAWEDLRVDVPQDASGVEKAVLHQRLIWETPDGDYLLEEHRTLTVPAQSKDAPGMIVWQSSFTPADDAVETLLIDGHTSHGLQLRLADDSPIRGTFSDEESSDVDSPWLACAFLAAEDQVFTIGLFDAPENLHHPTGWSIEEPGQVTANLGLDAEPLSLELGKTATVRFGVALIDGLADQGQVSAAYLDWVRLQATARSGLEPGLIGQYKADAAPNCWRIDPAIRFHWADGMPSDRLPTGPFSVAWRGQLLVQREGEYRFSLDTLNGVGHIWIDDLPAIAPILLDYGYHTIAVGYTSPGANDGVQLVWESDHFAPEVVNPRFLVHDAADESAIAMELLAPSGRTVFERSGCARCHAAATGRRPGPPLSLAWAIQDDYLSRWLADPQSVRPGTRMPNLAIASSDETLDGSVSAIVAYLRSSTVADSADSPRWPDETDPPAADERTELTANGRERFHQIGCAACHSPEVPQEADPALAPSLADVVGKWSESRLEQFLADPLTLHPEGRMPDFALKSLDTQRLAAYLSTFQMDAQERSYRRQTVEGAALGAEAASSDHALASVATDLIARGKQLVQRHGCVACHDLPGESLAADFAPGLSADSSLASGCLGTSRTEDSIAPRFTFSVADRIALAEFLARHPAEASVEAAQETAARLLTDTFSCLRCHVRDGLGGQAWGDAVARWSVEQPALDQVALTPPELSGVGTRLRPEWMLDTLTGNPLSARPWLTVRMPRFAMSDEQRLQIATYLSDVDAIPQSKAPRPHGLPTALEATAGALLSPAGFSCVNCHYIGSTPSTSETSAPDLTMIADRVGRDWFHRWLADPARIIPSTPMPAFNVPAAKMAGEDLLLQKETVWQFLKHADDAKLRGTMAENSTAVQVAGLRPSVVQGRVEGFAALVRGLALGFPNHNSTAFDFNRVAWRGDWKGGFLNEAGQHGAKHYWNPDGQPVWTSHDNSPTIVFRDKKSGQWIGPAMWRERFGFVDCVTLVGRAVRIEYRLRAPGERTGTHDPEAWVHVVETIQPNPAGTDADGLTRLIEIRGVPDTHDVIVQRSLGRFEGQVTCRYRRQTVEGAALQGKATDNDHALVSVATVWNEIPQGAAVLATEKNGRCWVTRVEADPASRWIRPAESITYPVEQPFTDELPMDPTARFDPVVTPGEGRLAVLVENPGDGQTVSLLWQTAELGPGVEFAAVGPSRWETPPEDPILQDPAKPRYVSYPQDVDRLGQSAPLVVPPGFRVERLPLDEEFLVCGLKFYRGKLLAGGYDGQLRFIDDTDDDGLPDSYRYFGGTLQQVTNLCVFDDQIYVTAPGGVYRIVDTNGDEVADRYELLSSLWDCSAHQNDWFFGLTRDAAGNLYGANSTAFIYRPGGLPPGYFHRGDVLKITPDGRTVKVGTGTRFQFGWAQHQGRMYFNINQGHYNYTNGIHQVVDGAHYGFLEPDLSKVQMPVVRAPYPWCKSLNGMTFADSPEAFGPFQEHGFSADYNTNQVIRWTDYEIGTARQGACYPFFTGTDAGPTEIVFGPDGALYVAFMCDQGWYAGRARSGIYKVTYVGPTALAITEARATKDGFAIEMTAPVDPASVTLDACPKVHRWWHENKGDYASPEIAHEDVAVRGITLSSDGRTLLLATDPHVTPRLVRVELTGLRGVDGVELTGGLAYLTVHWLPGEVTKPKSDW